MNIGLVVVASWVFWYRKTSGKRLLFLPPLTSTCKALSSAPVKERESLWSNPVSLLFNDCCERLSAPFSMCVLENDKGRGIGRD